ncbi:MAG: hypothetical protein NPIRA02_02680 [Nitrospirales bacterium]|nr:MAG: hypothetical protein NPIRA02_02680 [Nitrospirales bacterium]
MERAERCDSSREDDGTTHCSSDRGVLKKKLFSSWDQFMVPYPASKALFIWGAPIWVDPTSSREVLEAKRLELERTLVTITLEADADMAEL